MTMDESEMRSELEPWNVSVIIKDCEQSVEAQCML